MRLNVMILEDFESILNFLVVGLVSQRTLMAGQAQDDACGGNKDVELQMLKRDTRWTLVFEDFKSSTFDNAMLEDQTNFVHMTGDANCCIIQNKKGQSKINQI